MWRIASVTENVFAPVPAEGPYSSPYRPGLTGCVWAGKGGAGRKERVGVVTCDQTRTGLDDVLVQGDVHPRDRRGAVGPKGKSVYRIKHRTCSEVHTEIYLRSKGRCV